MIKQKIKFILLVSALCCFFTLTGCSLLLDYAPRGVYRFSQPEDQITTIEVVYMDPFCDGPGDEIKVIYAVTEIVDSDPKKFLEDFCEVTCFRNYRLRHPSVGENVIRIVYKDGAFELIGAAGVYYIRTDNRVICHEWYFDETEFREFMNKSVDESFENK